MKKNFTTAKPSLAQKGKRPHRVTLTTVAKAAGVSHTTVSLVLRGKGNVSEERRAQILRLVDKLGYLPNFAAQILRTKKSGYISLITPGGDPQIFASDFQGPMLGSFLQTCEKFKQKFLFDLYLPNGSSATPHIQRLENSFADGYVVGGMIDPQLMEWFRTKCKVPWVSLDEPSPHAFIHAANQGFEDAVKYLHKLGHRRLAYFGRDVLNTVHHLGLAGYRGACKKLNISERNASSFLLPTHANSEGTLVDQEIGRLLSLKQPPTAILCHGVEIARFVHTSILRRGLVIPRDISLVARGLECWARDNMPSFTVITPDFASMLDESVSVLRQLIDGKRIAPQIRYIPMKLIPMESTASLR